MSPCLGRRRDHAGIKIHFIQDQCPVDEVTIPLLTRHGRFGPDANFRELCDCGFVMIISVFVIDQCKPRRARSVRLLRAQYDMRVIGESDRSADCLSAISKFKPNVVLLDLDAPRQNSHKLLPSVRQESPHTKVVLLTRDNSRGRVLESLSFGAVGWIKNRGLTSHLAQAIRKVHAGEAWLPRRVVRKA